MKEDGVWRTIRGRRIFIVKGESLGQAMSKSGKFKREDIRKGKIEASSTERINNLSVGKKGQVKSNNRNVKILNKYRKKSDTKDDYYISTLKNNQAPKNRINEQGSTLYGDKRTERNKMRYSEADRRELRHEELQKRLADYKAKKQSNNKADPYDDPESNESQRLQDIQRRYDEYLQDTEGRGASYGEIAYVDSLRGKDLDDFEKELDDYYNKEDVKGLEKVLERQKTKQNETIKNYVEKKKTNNATKKDKNDWLPKATEIKEQGKSNRKEVSENIQAHILSYYDKPEDFIHQMDIMKQPTNWHNGQEIARGGSYLIYNQDMSDFLDSLKINPKGKKFSEDKAFETYTSLIGRESAKLYDKIKKHEQDTIKNYKNKKGK